MKFNQEVEAGGVLTAGREPGATGVATEDLCLAKRVKELEVQAMQVHIRAPEGLLPCPRRSVFILPHTPVLLQVLILLNISNCSPSFMKLKLIHV